MFEMSQVTGIGTYEDQAHGDKNQDRLFMTPNKRVFAVIRPKTIELRCDPKLRDLLRERYETVMESRYFGKGGIEIIPTGQIPQTEIQDLVRLSYNLTLQGA